MHICELDVDECLAGSHNCHVQAICLNTDGSFDCLCDGGWSGDGRRCSSKFSPASFLLKYGFRYNVEPRIYYRSQNTVVF